MWDPGGVLASGERRGQTSRSGWSALGVPAGRALGTLVLQACDAHSRTTILNACLSLCCCGEEHVPSRPPEAAAVRGASEAPLQCGH